MSFGKEYNYLSLFQFIDIVFIAETFVGVIDVYSKLETNEHFDKCKGVYFIFVSILVPVIVLVSIRLCIANNYSYTWMLYALAILLMLCKLMVELSFYNSKRWFIVEDIVDTGLTMQRLLETLQAMNPKEIRIATLLVKPDKLMVDLKLDYVAMNIPNDFIVGYGLDYDGLGRNYRDIYTVVN